MTDRELLQEALDALTYVGDKEIYSDTIDALRARLAQPEQEPLEYWNAVEGWVKIDEVRQHFDTTNCGTIYKHEGEGRIPLYAEPPQHEWVGLTDAELESIYDACDNWGKFEYERRLEAKLKEKNG